METKKLLFNWHRIPIGMLMRTWLCLLPLLCVCQTAKALDEPEFNLYGVNTYSYYYPFFKGTWKFFDHKNNNSGYKSGTNLWLTINGNNVIKIDGWDNYFTTLRDNEEEITKVDKASWYIKTTHRSTDYGVIQVYCNNLKESSCQWTCDIYIFIEFPHDIQKVGIKGSWQKENGSYSNSDKWANASDGANGITDYPTVSSIKRVSNGKAQVDITGMKEHWTDKSVSDGQFDRQWDYAISLYKEYQTSKTMTTLMNTNITVENSNDPAPAYDKAYELEKGGDNAWWGFDQFERKINKYALNLEAFTYDSNGGHVFQSTAYFYVKVGDNYKALQLFPQIAPFVQSLADMMGGELYVYYPRNYDGVWVNGLPRPKNVQTVKDTYNKKVTLSWDVEIDNEDHVDRNGRWIVYRQKKGDANSKEIIKELADASSKDAFEFTDTKEMDYNQAYTYTILYQPKDWTVESESDVPDLYKQTEVTLTKDFKFTDLKTQESNGKIVFSWKHAAILNASNSNPITFTVERKLKNGGSWEVLADNITVKNADVTDGSYTDGSCSTYVKYVYRVSTDVQEQHVVSNEVEGSMNNGSTITGFTATRGNYSSTVKLSWTVNQVGAGQTYFELFRRPLGSQKESDWASIQKFNGTYEAYSFDDVTVSPGSFNEYKLTIWNSDGSEQHYGTAMTTDGFALALGIVSGRITYGSGTAVKGAQVTLTPNNADGSDESHFRSLYIDNSGQKSGIKCIADADETKSLFSSDYSLQLYVKPLSAKMSINNTSYCLLNTGTGYLNLVYRSSTNSYDLSFYDGSSTYTSTVSIPANQWSHVTMVCQNNKTRFYVRKSDLELITSSELGSIPATSTNGTAFVLGNNSYLNRTYRFGGYVDELRFFTRALSVEDIEKNYNHTLAGSEKGLSIYWPLDEGISEQYIAYDFSKRNDLNNGHHGMMDMAATSHTDVPSKDQLSLMAYTDEDGMYTVNGIGFSGEGTSYKVTPTLGVHEFSPSKQTRFFNMNSLNHSGVDFEDVSSFPVSGTVTYEGTTIPVEDVYIYVDGVIAAKEGQAVKTNADGEYVVDVPIGDHFISIEKNGHVFKNGGRYPNELVEGHFHTFEGAIEGLNFQDVTRVTVAGRVAGGDVQTKKPLGVGDSQANIGQAVVTLSYVGNEKYDITENSVYDKEAGLTNQDWNPSTYAISSTAKLNNDEIVITTDPNTGEWAAELLPLKYEVKSVVIPSHQDYVITATPTIDATNPLVEKTDTLKGTNMMFKYCASAKITYTAPTTFDIIEREDGSFGEKTFRQTVNNEQKSVDLYTKDNEGKWQYTYGYPVYKELNTYSYRLHAYEHYVNYDNPNKLVEEVVPLVKGQVRLTNNFSTAATVFLAGPDGEYHEDHIEAKEVEVELDSLGWADYQFTAGLPNMTSPYSRSMSVEYKSGGTWRTVYDAENGFKAIVLGCMPMGNDFVTEGPDEVQWILRDPPGSNSYAVWNTGTTITKGGSLNVTVTGTDVIEGVAHQGADVTMGTGGPVIKLENADFEASQTLTLNEQRSFVTENTWITETTNSREIQTSSHPSFVGAPADIFVGVSKNLVFGMAKNLNLYWDDQAGKFNLFPKEVITMGDKFSTEFVYTAHHIENILIPRLEFLRDSTLQRVASVSAQQPANDAKTVKYVTELTLDDENFATNNDDKAVWGDRAKTFSMDAKTQDRFDGPSYSIILPALRDKKNFKFQDMVCYYNEMIRIWKKRLADNEKAKVDAINNLADCKIKNYSISPGSMVTETQEEHEIKEHSVTESYEASLSLSMKNGCVVNGVGCTCEVVLGVGTNISGVEIKNKDDFKANSYTLQEEGDDDYLSVDILQAPDNLGTIFYTRAGATSCPYEDEVVTKYHQPGTIISQKTLQIEKPEIEIENAYVNGVPTGQDAVLTVKLRNNSDTNEDVWFNLNVVDYSNPNGLAVMVDGDNITKGHTILVEAGREMRKTFTVRQTVPDTLNYNNVMIRIASLCQPDNTDVFPEIADTAEFSVHFLPVCSDVELATSARVVNTNTTAPLVLSVGGYNYNMSTLQSITLQYKKPGNLDFSDLYTWTKKDNLVDPDNNIGKLIALSGTEKLTYVMDLRETAYLNGAYTFRAITNCLNGDEIVNNESEEIIVVRDMDRPMLIATPSPSDGILGIGDDLIITFNEDIQNNALTKLSNFEVKGILNETNVAHDVALNLSGNNVAKTDATMDLSNKPFSVSFWLNYTQDGRLLQHGTADNNFTLSIRNGKLVVNIGEDEIESQKEVEKDKWLYMNVSYRILPDDEGAEISAGYAKDATSVALIPVDHVSVYEGNGPISLGGNNVEAKMQELTFWDGERSLVEAQASMYETKSQYTQGLLSYWQLNEGHGNVATDKARSRNLTLPSQNAWWISGENYALELDGNTSVSANISTINTTSAEDYLIEAWFKANTEWNKLSSILSTQNIDLRLNNTGQMELSLNNGEPMRVHSVNLFDDQWHHVAVNVLKSSNGSVTIYVDGEPRKQFSASLMPNLFGEKLMLGSHRTSVDGQGLYTYDQMLKGAIDEVRIWNGRRMSSVINDNIFNRLTGNEGGLVAYYPMEKSYKDDFNQYVTTPSETDASVNANLSGDLTFYVNCNKELSANNTATLKQAPRVDDVNFSFVASERQIKINLEAEPYKMNGCNIYITAKNVKDVNGNIAQPITWGVYVNQATMAWATEDVAVQKKGAETATFTATIENRGSESEAWAVSGLPEWLGVNVENGTLKPQSTADLTFTVNDMLPIGTYETTITLMGSQNIPAPLSISVTSIGEAPEWVATPGENTMTIVGQLNFNNTISSDPNDMVAAFRGTECVGVAQPKYFKRYDAYMVMMNIYGKNQAELNYKAYDASTGQIYPSVSISDESAFTFVPDKAIGTFGDPVIFSPLNEIEQDLSHDRASWKWFSLYAQPKTNDVSVVFKDAKNAINAITDGKNSLIAWTGTLTSFEYDKMYKLNATEPYVETVIGEPVSCKDIQITLNNGWTWLGYPCQYANTLNAAFASISPEEGDIVKNQSSFALYTEGEWVGLLSMMQPGDGFMYCNNGQQKQFYFPEPALSGRKNALAHRANVANMANAIYKDNMTMIAVVMDGDKVVENAEVNVYAGTELRGFSAAAVRDSRHFITIGGEDAQMLTYVVKTAEGEYQLQQADIFQANAMKGTMAQPYVLQLNETTGIDTALSGIAIKSVQLIDNGGRIIGNAQKPYTKEELKHLPAGVYYQQVIYQNGQNRIQKLMR